ncbi:hypothetical protein ACA910_018142 [Epithemia clementina (nom. ined.)]
MDGQSNSLVNNRHSASDWFYNVKSIPQSGVLKEVLGPVKAVACWSLFVSMLQRLFWYSNSNMMKSIASGLCIPATAHSFLVSALGLLLVFRTNSSYQRFYEGRKIWENILNHSRNLSRMIQLYSKEVGEDRERLLLNLIAAFPYLLRLHIRPGCLCESPESIDRKHRLLIHQPAAAPVDTRYDGDKAFRIRAIPDKPSRDCWVDRRNLPWSLFEKSSLGKLARAKNRPLWVCDRLGREIMSIEYGPNYTSRERLTMLSLVGKLTDALGQCERIHQTAVPLNYARHSLRSLTLWLFTLPFALVKDLGFLTAPVTACTAWLLYGIYQIGYSIEDPFQGSLRLSILCDAIRRDVLGNYDDRDSAFAPEDSWEVDDERFSDDGEDLKELLDHKVHSTSLSKDPVTSLFRETGAVKHITRIHEQRDQSFKVAGILQ